MNEPEEKAGTIPGMRCPECGVLGVRYHTGEDALTEWKNELSMLSTPDPRMGDDYESPVTGSDGKLKSPYIVPDDIPPEADVLYCLELCSWVKYCDIAWEKLPKSAML